MSPEHGTAAHIPSSSSSSFSHTTDVALPHGGELKDLIFRDSAVRSQLIAEAKDLQSLVLTERHLCDLELIMNGGFSPLDGFMTQTEYEGVVEEMRLPGSGLLWSIPITLDVSDQQIAAAKISPGSRLSLRDPRDDNLLAILTVSDIYTPNKRNEALKVFGSEDDKLHPAIEYLHDQAKERYVGGKVQAISLPAYYDFVELRNTPAELRQLFKKLSWNRIVAFQTRNPMHRAHRELTVRGARSQKCNILIHPVVGLTKPGDIDHYTRVRVYKSLLPKYPQGMATLSLLPIAMRMGGPREAIWHAIIRKNYGCTHFIVGRDHAGPGKNKNGKDFYGPYDAQVLISKYVDELGVQVVPFQMVSYIPDRDEYIPSDQIPDGTQSLNISGTELRRMLRTGSKIPDWFTYPEVQALLRQQSPPRKQQGITIYLTGFLNSGANTIARALQCALDQEGTRRTTLFLGESVQQAKEISMTAVDQQHVDFHSYKPPVERLADIETLAFCASQVSKNGGIAILTPLIGTAESRVVSKKIVDEECAGVGGYYVIHVNTPLEVCESLDRLGVYAGARNEKILNLPGVNGKFDPVTKADLVVDTSKQSVAQIIREIILLFEQDEFVGEK